MPVKHEEDQVAIMYYLLRPQGAELEPEPLELGELIIVFSQKEWKVVKLNRKNQVEKYDRFGISSTQESRMAIFIRPRKTGARCAASTCCFISTASGQRYRSIQLQELDGSSLPSAQHATVSAL